MIGRLNGDAYGFALHAMWGCDIIIAREDVIVSDQHLALHPVLPWGQSAGDGVTRSALFMTPTKLKEFLLLGPSVDGEADGRPRADQLCSSRRRARRKG